MQESIHPATRRLAWLVVVIGAGATGISLISVLNSTFGIALQNALNNSSLLVFGLLWLITGMLAVWWLRATPSESENGKHTAQDSERYDSRLLSLEKAVQAINARLDGSATPRSANDQQLRDLNLELDNFGTTLQDTNRRIDDLNDVNARLDDLASQVDALYVAVHDAQHRIDGWAQTD